MPHSIPRGGRKLIRPCSALLSSLGSLALLLIGSSVVRAQPDPGSGDLPVFTSPIDITGLKVQLRVTAPDRETGEPVDVMLPVDDLPGPKMKELFSTPLSTQIDQYWNATRDPKTGMTLREAACNGNDGIVNQVAKEVAKLGSSYSAYDISCNLAPTGQLLAKQIGSTMFIAYQVSDNTVSFTSTSPGTCRAGHGTPFCPNDPRFTVHFATQIVTIVRTPGLCQINADTGTVYVVAASIEANNAAAEVAKFFGGQKFVAAEVAITNTVRNYPLPLDASFNELRTSDVCTSQTPAVSRIRTAFSQLDAEIDLRQGIILRASHVGIESPSLDVPNPGGVGSDPPVNAPSFTRPAISTTQPLVTAGNAVQTSGQYFPLNIDLATALPVTLKHGGYGQNGAILDGGVCLGSATELEWGPVGGPLSVERLQGDAQGRCAERYEATKLTPSTAYQFRARDCDLITCSPWSTTLKVNTATIDPDRFMVVLTLDGATPLGTATVNAQGTFETSITIPAGTSFGAHTIHAVNGDAAADVTIQVTAPTPTGASTASIMMVGLLEGETGCPNHPISSTQTDDTFMLFGAGFAPGTVTIHLDTTTGSMLGIATVRADGSICQQMQSPPSNEAGAHTLVAAQNGAVVAKTAVTFVLPNVVR